MAHTKYSSKFYWIINKTDEHINLASQDESQLTYGEMEILGYEESKKLTWVAQYFHIIEMKVPNEIIQFKATP